MTIEVHELKANLYGSRNERKEYRKQGGHIELVSPRTQADILNKRVLKRQDKENYRLERAAYWADFHEKAMNGSKEN
jgi:hypothetical protein